MIKVRSQQHFDVECQLQYLHYINGVIFCQLLTIDYGQIPLIYLSIASRWLYHRTGKQSIKHIYINILGIIHQPLYVTINLNSICRQEMLSNVRRLDHIFVIRICRRQYGPVIIEKTIGLVFGPSTALSRSYLKHCTLTNKAAGTIWRDLSKPPQRRQGPDPRPLWLIVGNPSALGPELASR